MRKRQKYHCSSRYHGHTELHGGHTGLFRGRITERRSRPISRMEQCAAAEKAKTTRSPPLGVVISSNSYTTLSPGCRPVDRRQPCRPFVNRCQPLSTCRPVDLSTVVNHLSTTCQPVNRDPMIRRCRPCRPVDLSTCRPLSTVVNRCQPLSTSVHCVGCDILHLKAMLNQCQLRWEGKECRLLTCQPLVNRCQPLSTVVNRCLSTTCRPVDSMVDKVDDDGA